MMFKCSSVALLAVLFAVCALLHTAQAVTVYVYAFDVGSRQTTRPLIHVVAKDVPGGNTFLPSIVGNVTQPRARFDLAPGEYEFVLQEPGYYYYSEHAEVAAGPIAQVNLYLVPISQGVTLFALSNGATFPNMTIPAGVFPFTFASALAGKQGVPGALLPMYNWGSGTPPTTLLNLPNMYVLSAAQAGTYRFYVETYHALDVNGTVTGPTWMTVRTRFVLFAGLDASTGFKASIQSSNSTATRSWYVGDVVVTNPSSGCASYHWQGVDTYSNEFGADQTNHGSGALVLDECYDVSAPALACNDVLYDEHVNVSTCGAFGDPHFILFNRSGVTCGNETISVLIDNDFFALTTQNSLVADASGATTIVGVTLFYKSACNPTTIVWTGDGAVNFTAANAPFAGRHRLRQVGNNVYLDALHMRLQVRFLAPNVLTFGISIPTSLATVSTGICSNSCPLDLVIDTSNGALGAKRASSTIQAARDACTDAGIAAGSFEFEACTFDVALTGNAQYANAAAASTEVQRDVAESWAAEPAAPAEPTQEPNTPELAPTDSGSPSNSTSPSDTVPAPVNAAPTVSLSVALFALVALVQGLL